MLQLPAEENLNAFSVWKRREGRPPGRRAEPGANEPDPCMRSLAPGPGKLLKVLEPWKN